MIKVGINGFGRIGRFVFRAAQKRNDIENTVHSHFLLFRRDLHYADRDRQLLPLRKHVKKVCAADQRGSCQAEK